MQVCQSVWILRRERCTVISGVLTPVPFFKRCCHRRCNVSPTSCTCCFPKELLKLGSADPTLGTAAHSSGLLQASLEPCCLSETLLPSHRPWDRPKDLWPSSLQMCASRAGETPLTSHCVLSGSFSFLCDFDWGLKEGKQRFFYRPTPF